ncbi:hypothetical protein B0H12DRAFT_1161219 [Mycena haematopus]|nr:hypothetical protein B0H12DRAFT_1161219 [Mycena haematopus]
MWHVNLRSSRLDERRCATARAGAPAFATARAPSSDSPTFARANTDKRRTASSGSLTSSTRRWDGRISKTAANVVFSIARSPTIRHADARVRASGEFRRISMRARIFVSTTAWAPSGERQTAERAFAALLHTPAFESLVRTTKRAGRFIEHMAEMLDCCSAIALNSLQAFTRSSAIRELRKSAANSRVWALIIAWTPPGEVPILMSANKAASRT